MDFFYNLLTANNQYNSSFPLKKQKKKKKHFLHNDMYVSTEEASLP